MTHTLAEIAQRVAAAPSPRGMSTRIVGIDGCGGAGKSTFAASLAAHLAAQVVQTDDFASWDTTFDWQDRLLAQVLDPLGSNAAGRYQRYDWGQKRLAAWHDVPVQPVVVLEGVSSTRTAFRPFLSFRIFIEAPADLRLQRGLARDGADALPLWQTWQAEEDAYLAREDPRSRADLILDGTQPLPAE